MTAKCKISALALALPLILLQISYAVFAQYATPTGGSVFRGRARLFIADNSPQSPAIAVIDLPAYNLTQRIQVPGTSLQLGVSHDNVHVGVFRNRDNNQQYFSVINTGILPVLPVAGPRPTAATPLKAGELGLMRPAVLSKSIKFVNGSDAIGGVEGGRTLVYHEGWRLYLAYAESYGTIYTYRAEDLHAAAAFRPASTFQLPVGHYHAVPYGNFIAVPHTGVSKAFILDSRGRVVREYACTACHGVSTYMGAGGSMTAVFGCNTTVLVVRNTSANGTHLPAFPPRVGSFVDGVPGVFWSSNSAQRFFWRTDVRSTVPRISNVTHRGGIVRMLSLPSRGRFVAVHTDGNLVLYDGDSGAALASVLLRAGGFPTNQTAPFLQSDGMDEHLFVSVPALGVVHVVDVDHGGHEGHDHGPGEHEDYADPATMSVSRTVVVGGMPTAMTLAYMPGVTSL